MSYVSTIAESVISHSGGSGLLGPEVYTAVAEWEKREIPVSIVLDTIEEVFVFAADHGIESIPLEVLQDAVTANFRTWLSGDKHMMAA